MKAAPTLDGRLRIDVESESDVLALMSIIVDSGLSPEQLPEQLVDGMPAEFTEDWQDLVVPDLQGHFRDQLACVAGAISGIKAGDTLFIAPDSAEPWFGSLNQARLALEAAYALSDLEEHELDPPGPVRSALIRAHFYQRVQTMLLECFMK